MSVARLSGPERIALSATPRAVVYGCAGLQLTPQEQRFFQEADPFGFILFRRNCHSPEQVRALVAALRRCVGRAEAPVLIDQEGGRVARLRPPHWSEQPPARRFGELAQRDAAAGHQAAYCNARLQGGLLRDLGITINCAPVCDVPAPDSHDIIGDRAFAADPVLVASLAEAACQGLLAGGVLPVIKHIPGHGRARVDSHEALPVVDAPWSALVDTDFAPFRALAGWPLGMVAHVVYRAVDPLAPASISATVIARVIREHLGFDGLLFSDDLSMQALEGGMDQRAQAVLAAGCDIVLHCNGDADEMAAVAAVVPPLSAAACQRWCQAEKRLAQAAATEPAIPLEELLRTRDALLAQA